MTNNQIPKEIRQYKKDLQGYYAARQAFLWSAVGCFSGAILIIIALISGVILSYQISSFLSVIAFISIVAGIICFILRSALYNRRITIRKRKIAEYNKSQKQQK